MTSGKPFTAREDDFIKQNCNEQYPSLIARALAVHYSEDNGGSRSTKSVALRMAYWLNQLKRPILSEQVRSFMSEEPAQDKPRFDARKLNGRKKKAVQ